MNTDLNESAEQPKPAKKKVKAKAKRKPSDKAVPIKGGEYAGVSAVDCCGGCTAPRCVITTIGVCGHPYKASLPSAGPKTKAKIIEVKKLLRHQKIDVRND